MNELKFQRQEVAIYDSCKTRLMYHRVSLQTVYETVTGNGQLADATDRYRKQLAGGVPDKVLRDMKIQLFPMMMPACFCNGEKRKENICAYTGLAQTDLDHLGERTEEVMRRLCELPEIILAYRSLSGQGIHALYAYRLTDTSPQAASGVFVRAVRQGNAYIAREVLADYDAQVENPIQGQNLCHDPQAYFNPDAVPVEVDLKQPVGERWLRQRVVNDAKVGESQWPAGWTADKVMNLACRMVAASRTGDFAVGNRHNFLFRVGCLLAEFGMEEIHIAEHLEAAYGDRYREESYSRLALSCLRHVGSDAGRRALPDSGKGRPKTAETRLLAVKRFLLKQPLCYDSITRRPMRRTEDNRLVALDNREVNTLLLDCCEETGENITTQLFLTALHSDLLEEVNPLEDYVRSCPPWDPSQPDYLQQVAEMVHVAPTPLTADESASRVHELWLVSFVRWFVGMVAMWLRPEAVNHQVLCLIGRQGIYKTTWIESLLPPELEHYHCKQSLADKLGKDERARAAEFGMINIDEIDRLPPKCLEAFKALFTTQSISLRPLYMPVTEKRRRFASFAATGNRADFLTDMTGNRRWLPFYVDGIDAPQTNPLPHRGMYAQALYLLDHDYRYWFTADETDDMERHVRSFQASAPEKELLQTYFLPACPSDTGVQFLSASEMMALVTSWGNLRKGCDLRQFCGYLRELGFDPVRAGTPRRRGYFVIQKTTDAVLAERRRVPLEGHVDTMDT